MSHEMLDRLANVLDEQREPLMARWRARVRELPAARGLDTPTLNDDIPRFLSDLSQVLRRQSRGKLDVEVPEESSTAHGSQRLRDGYQLDEVVAEYNMLRACLHELAESYGMLLHGPALRIVNELLDGAIGLAVETYAKEKAQEVQQRREEYLAFVAHDLRTPLNAISLAARVLELRCSVSERGPEIDQMLKSLRRNVQHLESLVTKVLDENVHLDADGGIQLVRRWFDLWPLVESLLHEMHPVAAAANTRLLNHIPEELSVYADAGLVRRIFQNLIGNAIKYTPGGAVTMDAELLADESGVVCRVADDGVGIEPDRVQNVFNKFETDDRGDNSLGLGLAIVKSFVEAHDGQVTVDSLPGQGATFRFTIQWKK